MSQPPDQLVEHFFRHEAGRLTAWLTRVLGFERLEQAEDIVQDTLMQALGSWKLRGVPHHPAAWLYQVARRRALDVLRRDQRQHRLQNTLLREADTTEPAAQLLLDHELIDSQLRMLFACCHPALTPEVQLVLCLKILCGLSVTEIAQALLTAEDTIAKRLYRAKEKIREGEIALEVPQGEQLTRRLDVVLKSLYLLFNAGYNSAAATQLIRHDLCAEAMRLTLLLTTQARTAAPRTWALLALMCFQSSRFDTRTSAEGAIVLLRDQNRTQWDQALLQRAGSYLAQAAAGETLSTFHLEAAIAYEHSRATSFDETNWPLIRHYYDLLLALTPSAVVAMHRAVVVAEEAGAAAGLTALEAVTGLQHHYLYHAVRGDLLARLGRVAQARDALLEARLLTASAVEHDLLDRKMRALPDV